MPTVRVPALTGLDVVREETRKLIALIALVGFFLLLGLVIWGRFFRGVDTEDTTKLLTTTSSILSGVVGAIVGFYFRSEGK